MARKLATRNVYSIFVIFLTQFTNNTVIIYVFNIITTTTFLKVHNDTIFMGAFEENPTFVELDPHLVFGLYDFEWDVYMPYLEKHMEVMPRLKTVGQKTLICGPESFSPDSMPIFGKAPQVN